VKEKCYLPSPAPLLPGDHMAVTLDLYNPVFANQEKLPRFPGRENPALLGILQRFFSILRRSEKQHPDNLRYKD
jgi:hypothetical protein